MELTKEIREMQGKEYLFSGTFLDTVDRKEELYLVLKVKPSDYKVKRENGEVLNTFKCLVKNDSMEKPKWTKAFPIEKSK